MVIKSRDNKIIKDIIKLISSSKIRNEKSLFVIEGKRLCEEALLKKLSVNTALFTYEFQKSNVEFISKMSFASKFTYEISEDIATKISDTTTPQGVFFVCEKPELSLDFQIQKYKRVLVLERIQDPGNLGTIIRSANAFAVEAIFLSEDCADAWSPKVLRSAMGATFNVDIFAIASLTSLVSQLNDKGFDTLALNLSNNSVPINSFKKNYKTAIIVGNEGNGLSSGLISVCSKSVIIPMEACAQSLNASIAASIAMWEIYS